MRGLSRCIVFAFTFWIILLPTTPSEQAVNNREKREILNKWPMNDVISSVMLQETKRTPKWMIYEDSINSEVWREPTLGAPFYPLPTPKPVKAIADKKTKTKSAPKSVVLPSTDKVKFPETVKPKPNIKDCICCQVHMRHHKLCRHHYDTKKSESPGTKIVKFGTDQFEEHEDNGKSVGKYGTDDLNYLLKEDIEEPPMLPSKSSPKEESWNEMEIFVEAAPKTKTILLVGDETVDFLSAGRIKDLCVISTESYPGLTISDIEQRIEEVIKDGIIPEMMILQVGKNDLFPELPSGASRVIRKLKRLVDVLEAIMVRFPLTFAISGILPRPEQITSYNAKANLINEEVKAYSEPKGIKFIDHFRNFWRDDRVRFDLFTYDGGLNDEGMMLYEASLFNEDYCKDELVDEIPTEEEQEIRRTLELDDILPADKRRYDKNFPPKKEGQATVVYFHVTVLGIDSIDEESMTYVTDVFLAQSWRDYRLRLPENMTEEYRILDVGWLQYIWRPDSFFKNAKKVTFHEMSIPNHYLWLYFDKTLLYMTKLTLQLSCAMKFESYPHDTQTCNVMIESLSHTTDDLIFKWNLTDALVVNPDIELPQLDIVENVTEDCTLEYSTGNFTCLAVVFTLRRRLGYHLFHTYIPTTLIVVMSWISFWIRPEAIPARVTLGVTSLLTLATQNTQSQSALPPVSYVKAIDVFMSLCTIFVFMSLMEFAIVNHFMNDTPTTKLMRGYAVQESTNTSTSSNRCNGSASLSRQDIPSISCASCIPRSRCCTALWIDKFSRFFFPFSFAVLCLIYWFIYVSPWTS